MAVASRRPLVCVGLVRGLDSHLRYHLNEVDEVGDRRGDHRRFEVCGLIHVARLGSLR